MNSFGKPGLMSAIRVLHLTQNGGHSDRGITVKMSFYVTFQCAKLMFLEKCTLDQANDLKVPNLIT